MNNKYWKKLLSLLLVFGLLLCCFVGCSNSSGNNDDEDDEEDEKESLDDLRDELEEHEFQGLLFYLGKDMEASEAGGEEYALYTNGEITLVVVRVQTEYSSSSEFANGYAEEHEDTYESVKVKKSNGVSYVISEIGDGSFEVRGFYVEDSWSWMVYCTTVDYDTHSEDMIQYVTLAQVDKDSEADDEDADDEEKPDRDDPDTDEDPDDDEQTRETTAPTQAPPTDEPLEIMTVYAYLPADWDSPRCWAWSSFSGEDVFDEWPGELMDRSNGWYSISLPAWVNYVIINAYDGDIQTEDIAVESGRDVWIVIDSTASYYTLYYSEPDASELENYGY